LLALEQINEGKEPDTIVNGCPDSEIKFTRSLVQVPLSKPSDGKYKKAERKNSTNTAQQDLHAILIACIT
jgi:hypothetical protein